MDRLLGEVKKLVDNSLCDMKLCADDKAPKVMLGENVQTALNMHEGPWYMEQPKHVPGEFHKILGIQPSVVSPRSDSTNPPTALFAGKDAFNVGSLSMNLNLLFLIHLRMLYMLLAFLLFRGRR